MPHRQILIVEDDENINSLLQEALSREGYSCAQAFSGTEAKLLLEREEYQLVLLDLMLPGVTGEEVLREIRTRDNTPVIILTAKDEMDEKLELLTGGADDYITKPFEIKEVIARVQIQLRHARRESEGISLSSENGNGSQQSGAQEEQADILLTHREMVLDLTTRQVLIAGRPLAQLTRQEFAILELLFRNPRRVFSKEDIFEYAWEEPYVGETKTLDVHISNIRKKIKTITQDEYIETVWGIGYRLHP